MAANNGGDSRVVPRVGTWIEISLEEQQLMDMMGRSPRGNVD